MAQVKYHYVIQYGHSDENRPKGRPNKKWLDSIEADCSDLGVTLYEAT